MLAGFAFGAAVGLLRERDGLVATLQRLVMVVLGVLAPVLAAALLLFLLSIPFTGLGELWDSNIPATPIMLLAGAGAILLANAVIGNGADDRATSRVLRVSAQVLVLAVLPLAIIAAVSLGQRIGQYGWTPERIWGVVAVARGDRLRPGRLVGRRQGPGRLRRSPPPAPDQARARPVRAGAVPGAADRRFRGDLGEIANGALRGGANPGRRIRLAGDGVRFRPRRTRAACRNCAEAGPPDQRKLAAPRLRPRIATRSRRRSKPKASAANLDRVSARCARGGHSLARSCARRSPRRRYAAIEHVRGRAGR